MNTKKLFAIAVEAIAYISLISLLALLIALVYGLLMFLSPEPQVKAASLLGELNKMAIIPPVRAALCAAQDAPELLDYAAMNTRQLRKICRDRHVPKWNKLTKSQMIAALQSEVIAN